MEIDVIVIISFIVLIIIGYFKGFIKSILNLIFFVLYLLLAKYSYDNKILQSLNIKELSNIQNELLVYIVLGFIMFIIFSIIVRKILKRSVLKFIDRLGGVIIYASLGYLLICLTSNMYLSVSKYIEMPKEFKNSFFYSYSFKPYNILDRR